MSSQQPAKNPVRFTSGRLRAELRDAGADVRDVELDDLVRHVLDGEALRDDLLQRGGALEERLGPARKARN